MNRAGFISAALLTALFVGSAEARSPIEGRWKRGNLQIDIKPCGQTLCGTVVKASPKQQARAERGSGTDLIGSTVIRQIQPTGPNSYKARVFVPDRNMHASGKLRHVAPNRLQVSGCVLAFVCKSANWIRVN